MLLFGSFCFHFFRSQPSLTQSPQSSPDVTANPTDVATTVTRSLWVIISRSCIYIYISRCLCIFSHLVCNISRFKVCLLKNIINSQENGEKERKERKRGKVIFYSKGQNYPQMDLHVTRLDMEKLTELTKRTTCVKKNENSWRYYAFYFFGWYVQYWQNRGPLCAICSIQVRWSFV